MKKFVILALAAVFCMAIAIPATAEIKFSGLMSFDVYSHYQDEALKSGGIPSGTVSAVNDERTTQMNIWPYTNYLKWDYTNKDATLGATTGIYMGRRNTGHASAGSSGQPANWTFDVRATNIWWKPMPDVTLRFGSQGQIVGGRGGPGIIGGIDVICCNITAGNLHGSSRMGITADIKINDMVRLQLGAYDPHDDTTPALSTLPDSMGGFADEENTIPRFDIGLPIKLGSFSFKPKAAWVVRDFDQVAPNTEDDYDTWAISIDGAFTYGPLTLAGEASTGENLSDSNFSGGSASNAKIWTDSSGFTHIEDNEADLWFLDLTWKINPQMNIRIWYGDYEHENQVGPGAGDDEERERTNYGIRFSYYITPNFQFRPAYNFWDFGDDNLLAGVRTNSGEESVIGVGFILSF